MKATDKQIRYVHYLVKQVHGRHEEFLGSWAKRYGLTMRERSGRVDDMEFTTASKLIDGLKERLEK